jgi:nitrate reductase gamma subunit
MAKYDDLARLFEYPEESYVQRCRDAGLNEFADEMTKLTVSGIQELFISTFDWNPATTLDLGWHFYGEQYERGEFLVRMREELRRYGVAESTELPDHLTHTLRLLGRMDAAAAEKFTREFMRLLILEVTGLIFGLLTLVELGASILRRLTVAKVNRVTSRADWIPYAMLLFQVASGVAVALAYPWGTSWFATLAAPYFWSIVGLHPRVEYVSSLPWLVKLHIIDAYAVIGFFPFTRLVHALVVPNPYLWRKPQVVRWYRNPSAAVSSRSRGIVQR